MLHIFSSKNSKLAHFGPLHCGIQIRLQVPRVKGCIEPPVLYSILLPSVFKGSEPSNSKGSGIGSSEGTLSSVSVASSLMGVVPSGAGSSGLVVLSDCKEGGVKGQVTVPARASCWHTTERYRYSGNSHSIHCRKVGYLNMQWIALCVFFQRVLYWR